MVKFLQCGWQLGVWIPTGPAMTSPSKRSQLSGQLLTSWVGTLSL